MTTTYTDKKPTYDATDAAVFEELWKQVEGLARMKCADHMRTWSRHGSMEYEDLLQVAKMHVLDAARTFCEGRGCKWASWYGQGLPEALRRAAGVKPQTGSRDAMDACGGAISLSDTIDPLGKSTIAETIPDEDVDLEYGALRGADIRAVREAIKELDRDDPIAAEVIRKRWLKGLSLRAIADSMNGERSYETVRQIELSAIKRLGVYLRERGYGHDDDD